MKSKLLADKNIKSAFLLACEYFSENNVIYARVRDGWRRRLEIWSRVGNIKLFQLLKNPPLIFKNSVKLKFC
jgi:hypothetical protein